MIPLCDVNANYLSCKEEIDCAIERTIRNSDFILGKELKAFEDNFARYLGIKYCVGVSNATAGLFLALKTIGIGKGDEVIVPVNTVTADAEAVILTGARPRFVDCNAMGNIHDFNPGNAKAIIAVHMYGNPCDMQRLAEYNLPIIEDCSHAHGAKINHQYVGTFGDMAVFSFFPSKVLGGFGDGGCVVTDSQTVSEKIRRLRDHGRISKFEHTEWGFNFRLDGLQAAILNAKLPKLNEFVKKRNAVAKRYRFGLEINPNNLPIEDPRVTHSFYVYPIFVEDRNLIRGKLAELDISTSIHYSPIITHQKAYRSRKRFKIAEEMARTTMSLPMYPELSIEDQQYIIDTINRLVK